MSEARTASGLPGRGEVWLVRLPRAVGAELQRDRPAVVVSSAVFDPAPVRIVVPLTRWRDEFANSINKVRIEASDDNGLHEDSAADFLQVRSVAIERLIERLGELDTALVEEIVAGIVIGIDYRP